MTRANETHYDSKDATVIIRANSDDAWLFLPVCSLFVSGLGYLTILGPEGIAARHPNIDFNYGLIPFAFAFALALLLAKLYQFRWPTRYATHVTADRIAFYRSSLDEPEYLFHRDSVQSVRIRRRRWFHNPDMCDPIEFVDRSGGVTTTTCPATDTRLPNRAQAIMMNWAQGRSNSQPVKSRSGALALLRGVSLTPHRHLPDDARPSTLIGELRRVISKPAPGSQPTSTQ